MYFPYLRGRQFELIALRELVENNRLSEKIIPIIEPIKPSITLFKTMESFVQRNKELAVVQNPNIGSFAQELGEISNGDIDTKYDWHKLLAHKEILKSYIMTEDVVGRLRDDTLKEQCVIVNFNRDCMENFLEVYDSCFPRYTLIPDDRAFKRLLTKSKVIFEDCFNKKSRNVDYISPDDEFFSDSHLFYQDEKFEGFSDYSIVGAEFNVSGFAPVAVAIHVVYPDEENILRVHHFVSDSNNGIEDPAGKFGEALDKLVHWCDKKHVERTLGLQGFYDCYEKGKYPGLGVAKKYSIMHHLELVSNFLRRK